MDSGKRGKEPIHMSLRHREKLMVDVGGQELEQVGREWRWKGEKQGCKESSRSPFLGRWRDTSFWGYLLYMKQQLPEVLLCLLHNFSFRLSQKHPCFREGDLSLRQQLKQNSLGPKTLSFPLLPSHVSSGGGEEPLLLGPLFSSSVPCMGLAVLEPQSPGVSEVSRDMKPLSERQCPALWQPRPCVVKRVDLVQGRRLAGGKGDAAQLALEDSLLQRRISSY